MDKKISASGRRRPGKAKLQRVMIQVSTKELKEIDRAAKAYGQSRSVFIVSAAHQFAAKHSFNKTI